ncbi:hypothetical protein ABPG72_022181 [Tetrahymena utriculariae]
MSQDNINEILMNQQSNKKRDIYCKEVLPNQETKAKQYDILFTALNQLFERVVNFQKKEKQIQNQDVKDFITKSTQVRFIIEKLEAYKKKNNKHFSDPSNFNLKQIYIFLVDKNFIFCIVCSIIQILLNCGCIFTMDLITDKLKDYQGTKQQKINLCLLFSGISIAYVIKNILASRQSWFQVQWKANTYAVLQYLVFTKSLRAKVTCSTNIRSKVENEKDKSKNKSEENLETNNIMTTDIDQQQQVIWAITDTLVDLITIIVVLILIYNRIGKSIIQGLLVLISAIAFNIIIVYLIQVFLRRKYQYKDARISLSKDVIEGIKSIKYLGWEGIFKQKIDKIRSQEFHNIIITRCLDGVLTIFWNCISYFLLFFFLVNYVSDGHSLAGSNVFTIIALFGILKGAIGALPWSIAQIIKTRVSFTRTQKYLNEQEINYNKVINLDSEINEKSICFYKQKKNIDSFQLTEFNNSASQIAISIQKIKFQWPNKKNKTKDIIIDKAYQISNKISQSVNYLKDDSQTDYQLDLKSDTFQLKIFNFTINKGELAIIIGKIGSGKSALLQAILNELDSQPYNIQDFIDNDRKSQYLQESLNSKEDQIIVNGKVGYVSQNHWLQNKTVKENILFGKEYDPFWYNQCIQLCDLIVDFNTFSMKDEKIIGSGGTNLSGGQRQRIAICRALYQNCDIYLFDDIFSSLDVHVAEKIYQSVVVEFLIKKSKKTVLLVTSHFSIFSQRQFINKVFYLQNGEFVNEQGKIEEFIKSGINKEQVQEEEKLLQKKQEMQIDSNEEIELIEMPQQETEKYNENRNTCQEESQLLLLKKVSSKCIQKQAAKEENEVKKYEEEEEEKREKGSIKFDTIKTYFKSMGALNLLFLMITNFLMKATQMVIDFWLRDYVSPSSAFFRDINNFFNSFANAFSFFILINLGITIIRAIFYCFSALRSSQRLFNKLNQSIMYSKMNFFDKNPVGRIVNRLSNDINCIDDYLPWIVQQFLEQVSYSLGYPLGIIIQHPWLLVFFIASFALIYKVQNIFRILSREVQRLNSVNSGNLITSLAETCKGLILIRSFNKERFILREYMEKLNDSLNTYLITTAIQNWMYIRLLLISNFIFFCVAIASMVLIVGEFHFNYYTVSMSLTYSMLLSTRISDFIRFFCSLEQNMVSVERVRQYFNNDQETPNQIEIIQEKEQLKQEEQYQQVDSDVVIEFKNVCITYEEVNSQKRMAQQQQEVQFALKDFSLKIKRGEKVAICGRTGSGKTSILNALFNLYPIQSGSILVEGKNIKYYSLKQLRSEISIIPQFGFLYNASLRDNLDPQNIIPPLEIQKKIDKTNLKIRENTQNFEKNLKKDCQKSKFTDTVLDEKKQFQYQQESQMQNQGDLDFQIKEGGSNLSNGEKQVVNFFRIILRESDIICLDEATSNMDPQTDAELNKQIFKFCKNKTLLVITHRLENINQFNRVIVLEKGKIIESGKVSQLRKIQGGFFNSLIKNY